jgi:hypothetical protein
MSLKPRYWGTKKGEVLKSIVKSKWKTRKEILEGPGLKQPELDQVLSELISTEIISEDKNTYDHSRTKYWIEDKDLFFEYRDYLQGDNDSKYLSKEYREEQDRFRASVKKSEAIFNYIEEKGYENSVIKNVIWWSIKSGIKYEIFSEHFFIEGDLLDRLCKDVIDYSKSKVLVVNPFVDRCNLSDKLGDAGIREKGVTLLTRSPSTESYQNVRSSRRKYHGVLIQNGVKMMYNDRIHSKIIISDNELGIVSSMNFKSESSSGKNLEAGIVTWQKDTITSLNTYIDSLLKDYETIEFSG